VLESLLPITSSFVLGSVVVAVAELLFLVIIVQVWRMRNTFASLPRLEKPWIVLEGGVTLLFLGLFLLGIRNALGSSTEHLEEFYNGIILVSAVFILVAMVMMKRAWTVTGVE
jgi:hypothetical protein